MSSDAGADQPDLHQPDLDQTDLDQTDPHQTDGHQDVGDQEEVIPEPQLNPGAVHLRDTGESPEDATPEGGEPDADHAST